MNTMRLSAVNFIKKNGSKSFIIGTVCGRVGLKCICGTISRHYTEHFYKVEIYLANERSGLAFFSTDLGHIFRSNVGNDFGVILRDKGPHK